MLSFNEMSIAGGSTLDTFYENYRFYYDGFNRVNQITYTTNNPLLPNTQSNLTYTNDTIYDTIRYVSQAVKEVDTFITDLHGLITTTYIQGVLTNYSYYNQLLTRIDYPGSYYSLFTSYYGNFLKMQPSVATVPVVNYTYNIDMADRPGSYLHLLSMARYGFNFYHSNNLVRSIATPTTTNNLTYEIDADSKITRTTSVITDTGSAPLSTTIFDIQYEKYK
jgi:hypothetical protein